MSSELEKTRIFCNSKSVDDFAKLHTDTKNFFYKCIRNLDHQSDNIEIKQVVLSYFNDKDKISRETITITFGDQGENHAGMQKVGKLAESGFSISFLNNVKDNLESKGCVCFLHDLNQLLPGDLRESSEPAAILLVKGLFNSEDMSLPAFRKYNTHSTFEELKNLEWDTKAFMRGQVKNKNARYNLVFADFDQEPDFPKGKGTVVDFRHLPFLNQMKLYFEQRLTDNTPNEIGQLIGEGNRYYRISDCGIGYHGDSERRKVIAVRFGATMPIHYQWFINHKPIGNQARIKIDNGDVYFMSDKAVGFDWKRTKNNLLTLRHAAGSRKYTTIKDHPNIPVIQFN